jgi:alanyl-tRNA synthetase
MTMDAQELRKAFTDFFEKRGHTPVASSSLIPHDPTLLFTNAGMVPFKPYFLGDEPPPYPRATTVQKVVRAGGKHNDLDEVGRTSRHLTFFEMLGNFSFGDYFKESAIPMAWEFFTEVLGLDPERLWVTVHLSDDEAADIWQKTVGVPPERIQRLDEDNWWRMADTGPNGPCSEIFWDMGPDYGPGGGPANPAAEDRFVEIWNLVFMQFDQQADGKQIPLPKPSIDTGAGLERVLAVVQGVDAVWATDEFVALVDSVAEIVGVSDRSDPKVVVSLQILADHARSTTFLVNDGAIPSNEDRGYVLRRIVRRAVRHAHLLGVTAPVMASLVDAVVDVMGEAYGELVTNRTSIADTLAREEEAFRRTLESGSAILDEALETLGPDGILDGGVAFRLHDTYGFPVELTEEIAGERGVALDAQGFEAAMAEQRSRAKADHAAKSSGHVDMSAFQEVFAQHGSTEFMGRDSDTAEATVLLVADDSIVLDRTPFYAESGGQVGDAGTITGPSGSATVVDTVLAAAGQHRHIVDGLQGTIAVGDTVVAQIDGSRRRAIRRNHTGTHLLHWAMREVLGDHVKQQGSWVGPDRLRFDFSHYEPVTDDEIAQIEDLANAEVYSGAPVENFETTMDEARDLGAIAFFGDKYGDTVRVMRAGEHSIELCGGTHVAALAEIGPLKIVSEGSIGSNIRRIEAVSGPASVDLLRTEQNRSRQVAEIVGVPVANLMEGMRKRLRELEELQDEIKALRSAAAKGRSGELAAGAVDGVVVARVDGMSREDLREVAMNLRSAPGVDAVVLGAALDGGGAALVAAVDDGSGHNAAGLIADAAKAIKGGGGRGDDFAMAGGKDAEALDVALDLARAAAGIA